MYSFVRAKKILGKLHQTKPSSKQKKFSFTSHEKELILQLNRFPEIITEAAHSFQPLLIAKYTFELASYFNRFYETSRVINAETKELKVFRATLVNIFKIVMGNALQVLGIPSVEEM